jgi:acetolactate synthase-1/2/3 large subunit
LITSAPLRDVVASADVVLAVGTHFRMSTTGAWQLPLSKNLIHLDADPTVIGRTYPAAVALVADAAAGIATIADALDGSNAESDWLPTAQKAAAEARGQALNRLGPDHRGILDSVRRHLPRDGVIVRDATVPAYA